MQTQIIDEPKPERAAGSAAHVAKLLAGPIVALSVAAMPLGLPYEGRIALATFVCVIVWWMAQPLPVAISAMLPLLVFPAAGVMDIAATMALYGQPIFFWIMGTVLMGYAIEKHGLAQRIALGFLALPRVGSRASTLIFVYMLMVGVVSMFISDAATIAMMIPIGMSIVRHVRAVAGLPPGISNFGVMMTLGTLYASVAGGTATMMGVPHNGIVISMLERFTARQLGFFEWMSVGVPVFAALVVVFFATLWLLARPEVDALPGGEAFLWAQREKLGPMRPDERRVLAVFGLMVILFTLPAVTELVLGGAHAVTEAVARALPIWVVPPVVLFLLFGIRSASGGNAGLLTWKDAERHSPWSIMILVAAAVGMTDAVTQFGFVELIGGAIGTLGITAAMLPYVVAGLVAVTTNLISGTAAATLYSSIFIPAAAEIGYNPASIAILIANVAIGMALPWAGASVATCFAVGEIDMRRMIRIGAVATVVFSVVAATIHLLMARLV